MTTLPIKRIILYKHGVGYFERRAQFSGETLTMSFPRVAMDDVLKSLIALDVGAGQVRSIGFETPENRQELLAKGSIHLSDNLSLLDLLRDLRGRKVRCQTYETVKSKATRTGFGLGAQPASAEPNDEPEYVTIEGVMVGVAYDQEKSLESAILSIYQPDTRTVRSLPITNMRQLDLLDEPAAQDLTYFLRAAQSEEERRAATIYLTPGEHDLLIGYIAPAPAWRVSYRVLYEAETTEGETSKPAELLLQGWGLFDNQLEEDLDQVRLSLVAGMPISFRYRLYEPKTPQRPLSEDEERTVNAPIAFAAAPPQGAQPSVKSSSMFMRIGEGSFAAEAYDGSLDAPMSLDALNESLDISVAGNQRGALFAYHVTQPVSVSRGQSAMVPILSSRTPARRELIYNKAKHDTHPIATIRFTNETNLTLERGPVTVIEDGDYAGEAVVPFTTVGADVILAYAVELGITVTQTRRNETVLVGLRFRNDYLQLQSYYVTHTTYELLSTLDHPVDVVIDHALSRQATVVDMPPPIEEVPGTLRWKVQCNAQQTTRFVVHEQQESWTDKQIRSLNGQMLSDYLNKKLLTKETLKSLHEVIALYARNDQLTKSFQQIEAEYQAIAKKQIQIRGNITPLGREGDEGQLRSRYVAELNNLQDQLQQLSQREQEVQQQLASVEQSIKNVLAALQG